jgi:hypothetical protein
MENILKRTSFHVAEGADRGSFRRMCIRIEKVQFLLQNYLSYATVKEGCAVPRGIWIDPKRMASPRSGPIFRKFLCFAVVLELVSLILFVRVRCRRYLSLLFCVASLLISPCTVNNPSPSSFLISATCCLELEAHQRSEFTADFCSVK